MDEVENEISCADETEKKQSKASTNPMDFQPEIRELILQHLSGAELLDLSLVSTEWYEKIGKSKKFKSSIIIRIDPGNQNGHKKPRGDNTDWYLNPMDLPPHIVERILKSFSHDELLNATLVSKFWNSTIETSLEFRRRTVLTVKDIYHQHTGLVISSRPRGFEGLCNTQRKYQYLVIDSLKFYDDDHIWMRKQKWKEASICIRSDMTMTQYGNILEALGSAVEVLELDCLQPTYEIGNSTVLKFPGLKKLTLTRCEFETLLPLTTPQPKLEFFKWDTDDEAWNSKEDATSITAFLEENPTISELNICDDEFKDVFLHYKATNLAKLSIRLKYQVNKASERMRSFRRVIKQNEDTMKELTLKYHSNFDVLFPTWSHLSRLNYLYVKFHDEEHEDYSRVVEYFSRNRLKPNPNLFYIAIDSWETSFEVISYSFFKKLLRLTPNVEELFVARLTKEIIEFAAWHLMKLKTIHCMKNIEEAEGRYQQMKAEEDGINENIELKTTNRDDFVKIVKIKMQARILREN